ncbi:MAG: gluconeogenesis factor YvcK family protein [Chloroflexota bacterium]
MTITELKSASRLLRPGLGLKRWLIPTTLGLIIAGVGVGYFLSRLSLNNQMPAMGGYYWFIALLLTIFGIGLSGYSLFQINKRLLSAFLPQQVSVGYVADQVYRHRRPEGPKIVVIGGGTGLSTLLRGLKHHTDNITAIVTVADDGGSSGKLRRELGVLPPGDFRNCIAALADDEALTTQLFQYRFRSGEALEGHSFGNLFITAMAEVVGSFENALSESGRVLNIRGSILPSTLTDVTLYAELKEGAQTRKVKGESAIPEAKLPIERVYLEPDTPPAFPPALQAILDADLIVAGPGSLYTSVIPNLLVAELTAAIRASTAKKVYICNVATQPGETDNYSLDDHIQAIENHTYLVDESLYYKDRINSPDILDSTQGYLFNFVLANDNLHHIIPDDMSHLQAIAPPSNHNAPLHYEIIKRDIIDEQAPWRHDTLKLANQLINWYKRENKRAFDNAYNL